MMLSDLKASSEAHWRAPLFALYYGPNPRGSLRPQESIMNTRTLLIILIIVLLLGGGGYYGQGRWF